jgi:hypothetical protein
MSEKHTDTYLCRADNRQHTVEYSTISTSKEGVCPECMRKSTIGTVRTVESDTETGAILYDTLSYWCSHGCELDSDKVLSTSLDENELRREIMASRARLVGDSIEVFNNCKNPYLSGLNCLYIHWQKLDDGKYSVFYDYYLEYAYQGRDSEIGKKVMQIEEQKPDSKKAKELLFQWMIERFKAVTKN